MGIIYGDALDELKKLDDNSIDLVCTDPPYGYSFMGKDWDRAVPTVEVWAECLRVLKPGAFCFVMSAPRSDVQMHMVQNLTQAGFRLDFTPIYWTYASGFPKAGNIGKLVDKRLGAEREVVGNALPGKAFRQEPDSTGSHIWSGELRSNEPATPQAKALDGSYAGFQPKPAVEVIIVAMKPLSEKTFVDQALKNGKGVTWLDDCRVPTDTESAKRNEKASLRPRKKQDNAVWKDSNHKERIDVFNSQGRFPANLLVSDDVLNDGRVFKSGGGNRNGATKDGAFAGYGDTGRERSFDANSGSYSRYFDLDKWAQTLPFLIVPKASKNEKNKGLDGFADKEAPKLDGGDFVNPQWGSDSKRTLVKNHHPTVKPLKLMSYLITLGSREGNTVLDPFFGSGTTLIAAKKLKRKYVGIELEQEYVKIANARLEADKQESLL